MILLEELVILQILTTLNVSDITSKLRTVAMFVIVGL